MLGDVGGEATGVNLLIHEAAGPGDCLRKFAAKACGDEEANKATALKEEVFPPVILLLI